MAEESRPGTAASLGRSDTHAQFHRVSDITLPFRHRADVTWVVGIDGSLLSFRCLRLAAMMMNQSGQHHLVALNLVAIGEKENTTLMGKAAEQALRAGVQPKFFGKKTIVIPAGWSAEGALIYFANHVAGGTGKLVIGSFGTTLEEDSVGAKKFGSLGHFAAECLDRVKVPVTIVKDAWASKEGDMSALGRVLRVGRNGRPGLT